MICSSLVKAAMFGADANWGRVLCAIGYCGADVDVNKVDVHFRSAAGAVAVCQSGAGVPFSEEEAKKVLLEDEIEHPGRPQRRATAAPPPGAATSPTTM